MKIALIGTGMMGERMGGRLLDAGAEGAEFLVTMLADAGAVRGTARARPAFSPLRSRAAWARPSRACW